MREGVLLIGPRAAGKSTVGPLLAGLLAMPFRDADVEIEAEAGRSIADLMKEGVFRAVEAQALGRILGDPPAVVAAGGGAVLWAGFQQAAAAWAVVWLDASPQVLAERLQSDPGGRPSLTGREPAEEIGDVARARAPLYRAVADLHVVTDALTPDESAAQILDWVQVEPHSSDNSVR